MNRTLKTTFVLLLYIILLTGCKKKNDNTFSSGGYDNNEKVLFELGYANYFNTYSQQYAFYTGKSVDDLMLPHYYDTESFSDMVLCNKPSCDHDNENCFAKRLAELSKDYGKYIFRNKLYFLGTDDNKDDENSIFNTILYSADIDGSNLKAEVRIENLVVPKIADFYEDQLFIVYRNEEQIIEEKDENGSVHKRFGMQQNPYETGFYIYSHDVKTLNKVVVSTDTYNSELLMPHSFNNKLYFLNSYFDEDVFELYDLSDYESRAGHYYERLCCYDIDKNSIEVLYSDGDKRFVAICGDSAFYYHRNSQETDRNVLYKLKLESGESVKFYEGDATNILFDGSDYIVSSYENDSYWFTLVSGDSGEIKSRKKYEGKDAAFIDACAGDNLFFVEMEYLENGDCYTTLGFSKSDDYFGENGCRITTIGKI